MHSVYHSLNGSDYYVLFPFMFHSHSVQSIMVIVINNTNTDVATPMAGSMYSLTCNVTGAETLSGVNKTYQWFKDGVLVSGQTMETLSFNPLSFSDAGRYTCQATVTSSLLSGPITANSSNSENVTLRSELRILSS